jgi:hypothetical protein
MLNELKIGEILLMKYSSFRKMTSFVPTTILLTCYMLDTTDKEHFICPAGQLGSANLDSHSHCRFWLIYATLGS